MKDPEHPYVGRGGLKLEHALREFDIDPHGLRCADFGCNVGGFTDCLLRHGARLVYAVDTSYGTLEYRLRVDDRVTVMERTNALHATPPAGGVDLVVADMGWTPQRLVIPAALRWFASDSTMARLVTLIKPHYERSDRERSGRRNRTVLSEDEALRIAESTTELAPQFGARVLNMIRSPIRGGGSRGRSGNVEYLALIVREPAIDPHDPGGV
ncbi:MAG: SAM-dependent methyltransferase [Phycisphaerales bacterium]